MSAELFHVSAKYQNRRTYFYNVFSTEYNYTSFKHNTGIVDF
jgi:hypothetical protein